MACSPGVLPRRVLFITLEYKAGTFSGNGIYSQSIVRSLSKLGHSLFVISAGPAPGGPEDIRKSISVKTVEEHLVEIPVSVWGRLDWRCGWEAFEAGITADIARQVASFKPEWALVVDWSSLGVYKALRKESSIWDQAGWQLPTMTYLNYRVYTVSEYKGDRAAEEKEFYREKESEAVALASAVAALSTRDANLLQDEMAGNRPETYPRARALLAPLREDIRLHALNLMSSVVNGAETSGVAEDAGVWRKKRKYFSCCVRLSPEKNAALFASLVEHLAPTLKALGLVPLICCGAHSSDPYAQSIKQRVLQAVPDAEVIEGFLGPERMGELYSQTVLNVHPCLYDAYGMTMVEAAAFGAPTIVNTGPGGGVGAAELLVPEQGLSIGLNLAADPSTIAAAIGELLNDPKQLAAIAGAATARGLSWSEDANARQLTCIAEEGHKAHQ